MAELFQTLSEEWAIRALVASSMVGIMCGLIGSFIVLRNMSLIGDALAHAILPGIVVAFMILGYSTIGFFLGSVIAGLIAAVAITWIQHNVKTKNDAAIGIVFTVMFSLGVIGISQLNRSQGVHLDLKDFLFGTVLGISNEDIILTAVITLYTIISISLFYRHLFITTFQPTIAQTMGISVKKIHYFLMLLLSFAVVSSLRTVGVILVVAMLITPAATALLLSNKLNRVIAISAFIGFLSAALGLILAIIFETTPGPAMCVTATLIYGLVVVFSPSKGLIFKMMRKRQQRFKIEKEDIIKQVFRHRSKSVLTTDKLSEILSIPARRLKKQLDHLRQEGLISYRDHQILLTAKGDQSAQSLIRAHRLWETFLVDQVGLDEKQIHEEAEWYEHILTEEILDQVDEKLGYPKMDPHGSPIPQKSSTSKSSMLNLKPRSRARVSRDQFTDAVISDLWELGLTPDSSFQVIEIEKNSMTILYKGKKIEIPASLAMNVKIKQ